MSELLIERAAAAPLENTGDGWTLYGLAVPYGVESLVSDDGLVFYREVFQAGCFQRDVTKGARLMANLIERGVQSATVPAFPWSVLARLLPLLPAGVLARAGAGGNRQEGPSSR